MIPKRYFFQLLALFLGSAVAVQAQQVAISSIMYHPSGDLPEYLVVRNLTPTVQDCAEWKVTDGVDYTFPGFDATQPRNTLIGAFGSFILTGVEPSAFKAAYGLPEEARVLGPWTGSLSNGGERVSLEDKNGVEIASVEYNDRGAWPRAADGTGHALVLVNDHLEFEKAEAWEATPTSNPVPGALPAEQAVTPIADPSVDLSGGLTFIEFTDKWDYNNGNVDLVSDSLGNDPPAATDWQNLDYNFASHPGWTRTNAVENIGAPYGFNFDSRTGRDLTPSPGMRTIFNRPEAAEQHFTYYFRKEFTYNGGTAGTNLIIDGLIDDGVHFYLNGQSLGGRFVNADQNYRQRSSSSVRNAEFIDNMVMADGSALRVGRNVISAQVHQTSPGSSDIVFAAKLRIIGARGSSLALNEVRPGRTGQGFVEFYNRTGTPIDLQDWYLSDSPLNLQKFQFSESLIVPAFGFTSIDFLQSGLEIKSRTGVFLTAPDGSTVHDAFSSEIPIDGRSAGRTTPGGPDWALYALPTPGSENSASIPSKADYRINEVHFAGGFVEWIEIYNAGTEALDPTGLAFTFDEDGGPATPLTSAVPPRGHFVANTFHNLNGSDTAEIYLRDASGRVLDAVSIPSTRSIVAAWPDGSGDFSYNVPRSQGGPNPMPRETGIVITEIMADPPSKDRAGEFIELFNRGSSPVDLSGWRFSDGINYTFASGSTLAPGAYLVLASQASSLPGIDVFDEYGGNLSNSGERIRLRDANNFVVEEVDYRFGGAWPELANGGGSSLELINPFMDNSVASAWRDSDESQKSQWVTFTATEQYEQRIPRGNGDDYREMNLLLPNDGHIAIRNLDVMVPGNMNNVMIPRGTQLTTDGTGSTGWLCTGNHHKSDFFNGNEFHVISTGHGDEKANHCEVDVPAIDTGDVLTISFEARWISGCSTLMYETWDRSFGGQVHLPLPAILGTPGAVNSRATTMPLPTLEKIKHSPAVPTGNDIVKVTVEAKGADTVNLRHRLDTEDDSEPWATAAMNDDGINGDEVAGDGIFTVLIDSHQSLGVIAQFYAEATSAGGTTLLPLNGPERPAMWIVAAPTDDPGIRRSRFILSARDVRASNEQFGESAEFDWSFPRLSNQYFNATFINDEEDVFYNYEIRKRGSPFTRQRGSTFNLAKWKSSDDNRFRGIRKRSLDDDQTGGDGGRAYAERVNRYWLYLLGHPVSQAEFVQVTINGFPSFLSDELEPVGNGFVRRNFSNGQEGELYRIDDEFLLVDDTSRSPVDAREPADWSLSFGTEPEAYYPNWGKRTRQCEFDFSSLFSWMRGISTDSFSPTELENRADISLMAANAVVRGWGYDWDNFTLLRGKNGYFYRRPTDNRWMFLEWDSDRAFGGVNEDAWRNNAQSQPFFGSGQVPGFDTFINKPQVRREVNRYLGIMMEELTHNSPRLMSFLAEEEAASDLWAIPLQKFTVWNQNRLMKASEELGSAETTPFAITSANGGMLNTTAETISISGTAPFWADRITIAGRPDIEVTFPTVTTFQIDNVALAMGANDLQLEAFDRSGKNRGTASVSLTRMGDGTPVIQLTGSSRSFNQLVTAATRLDASQSYDPEGSQLTFAWTATPGVLIGSPSSAVSDFGFTTPGIATITLTVTDSGGQSATASRDFAVYAEEDFSTFGKRDLESFWTVQNVTLPKGDFQAASYSLATRDGNVTLQSAPDAAAPFAHGMTATFPRISRVLPDDRDWTIQTDFEMANDPLGDYQAGLYLNLGTESIFYGLNGPGSLAIYRATEGATPTLENQKAVPGREAIVRVRKSGLELIFEHRSGPGVWTEQRRITLATEPSVASGGIMLATEMATSARVAFDNFMLIDPRQVLSPQQQLRIVEIHYDPTEGKEVEFLELINLAATPIDLIGVNFDAGSPFPNGFTFGGVTLGPGERGVLVRDQAAFSARYPNVTRILGAWGSGGLSNGGEEIIMRDSAGLIIQQFEYNNGSPWPSSAAGGGFSLEIVNPLGDFGNGSNWQVSGRPGGTPGGSSDLDGDGLDVEAEMAANTDPTKRDTDGDGVDDNVELSLGSNPTIPDQEIVGVRIEKGPQPDELTISWDSFDGLRYQIEGSNTLASDSWEEDAVEIGLAGRSQVIVSNSPTKRFYRIRIARTPTP